MCHVVDEWNVGNKGSCILTLSEETPLKPYNHYRIDNKIYTPIPITGSKNWIAVRGTGGFIGKDVEFIKV